MRNSKELPIPEAVQSAREKMELARVWIADGNPVVTLSSNLWNDPGAWGLLLVDLAVHVANAYESQGQDATQILKKIREAFDAEWSHPTL
jgi:hypothetical protein